MHYCHNYHKFRNFCFKTESRNRSAVYFVLQSTINRSPPYFCVMPWCRLWCSVGRRCLWATWGASLTVCLLLLWWSETVPSSVSACDDVVEVVGHTERTKQYILFENMLRLNWISTMLSCWKMSDVDILKIINMVWGANSHQNKQNRSSVPFFLISDKQKLSTKNVVELILVWSCVLFIETQCMNQLYFREYRSQRQPWVCCWHWLLSRPSFSARHSHCSACRLWWTYRSVVCNNNQSTIQLSVRVSQSVPRSASQPVIRKINKQYQNITAVNCITIVGFVHQANHAKQQNIGVSNPSPRPAPKPATRLWLSPKEARFRFFFFFFFF